MLEMLMGGQSQMEIAKHFNLTSKSVANEMAFLEKEGLLKKAEEQILTELYPLALKVMKKHLTEQEARVGQTSIDGAKAILKEPLKRAAIGENKAEDMTLERWVIERKIKRPAIVEGEVSNVEIDRPIRSAAGILSAGQQSDGEQIQSGDNHQREESDGLRREREGGDTETQSKG